MISRGPSRILRLRGRYNNRYRRLARGFSSFRSLFCPVGLTHRNYSGGRRWLVAAPAIRYWQSVLGYLGPTSLRNWIWSRRTTLLLPSQRCDRMTRDLWLQVFQSTHDLSLSITRCWSWARSRRRTINGSPCPSACGALSVSSVFPCDSTHPASLQSITSAQPC